MPESVSIETNDLKVDGTLIKYEDGTLTIDYLDKTRKKTLSVSNKNVKLIRYAVKF